MKLLKEQIREIILEELLKVLDEINRRDFLKGAAAMCAAGVSSACETENELNRIIAKNERGFDYPDCVLHPKIEPDLNDSIWKDQVLDFHNQEYVGIIELTDFMSQPSFDHESIHVEEDGEYLTVKFANVPKDAEILRFMHILTGERFLDDQEIEDIFDTPQGEIVLTFINFKFKIFEYEGNQYIHHPTYERGRVGNVPIRNTSECSQALIQWMENQKINEVSTMSGGGVQGFPEKEELEEKFSTAGAMMGSGSGQGPYERSPKGHKKYVDDRYKRQKLKNFKPNRYFAENEEKPTKIKIKIRKNLGERCQKGYKTHEKRKTKKMFGKTYRNCVKAE